MSLTMSGRTRGQCGFLLLFCFLLPITMFGQAREIPVRVEFSVPALETGPGSTVKLELMLRNGENQTVPARTETKVFVHGPGLTKGIEAVFSKGQQSVFVEISTAALGVSKLEATSPQLAPGRMLLIVTPRLRGMPQLGETTSQSLSAKSKIRGSGRMAELEKAVPQEPATRGKVQQETAEAVTRATKKREPNAPIGALIAAAEGPAKERAPASSTSPPTLPTPRRLMMEIDPTKVFPFAGVWQANIFLILTDDTGVPAPTPSDLSVRLTSEIGALSSTVVRIPAGRESTLGEETIRLTSHRPGTEHVRATPIREFRPVERAVVYESPLPRRLRLDAHPLEGLLSDGRTESLITVLLLDEVGNPAPMGDNDVSVLLSATRGNLDPDRVIIRQGDFSSEPSAKLTSYTSGHSELRASAAGFPEASASITFVFPWLLVEMAALGGLLGGVVQSIRKRTKSLGKELFRNLVVGIILGVVFYVLVFFGAITKLGEVLKDVDIAKIPAVHALGALALGFIGGLITRKMWGVK